MIRKAHYVREGTRTVEIRSLKNFNRESFLRDLEQKQWDNICCSQDPNEMWEMWKNMLMETIDKHASRTHSNPPGNLEPTWHIYGIEQLINKHASRTHSNPPANLEPTWHIYGIEQLINESTRITATTSTLILIFVLLIHPLMLQNRVSYIYQLVTIH